MPLSGEFILLPDAQLLCRPPRSRSMTGLVPTFYRLGMYKARGFQISYHSSVLFFLSLKESISFTCR